VNEQQSGETPFLPSGPPKGWRENPNPPRIALLRCHWCEATWQPSDRTGFEQHQDHCALSIACPWCHVPAGEPCTAPKAAICTTHGRREKAARRAAESGSSEHH
jgi:hypothetical protein